MKKELAKNFIPKQYILEQHKKRDKNKKMIMWILICISIMMFPNTIHILSSRNNSKKQVNNKVQTKVVSYDLNDIISICNNNIDGQFNLKENIMFVNESEINNICSKSNISIEKIECISDDKYKIGINFEE